MDAQTLIVAVSGLGSIAVGVAIGRQMTVRRDINAIDSRVHRINNRLAAFPEKPDEVYARRDTVAIELAHIRESQERVEQQLARLVGRP